MASARNLLLLILFLITGYHEAAAQSQSTINWYFGNSGNALRFTRPKYTAKALTIPNSLGQGMSAVATDPISGDILFYTDGFSVYDVNDQIMPNGTGLLGSSTVNQSVAICPVPGQDGQFYIWTNDGDIHYSIVDMTLPGNAGPSPVFPTGEVVSKNQVIPALGCCLDQPMLMLPKASHDGFWLLLHDTGSPRYHVVDINNGGFGIQSYIVANTPDLPANLAYNAEDGLIAISPINPGEEVAVAPFDISTGAYGASATAIPGTGPSSQTFNIYDTEFSNNGQYLYISGNNGSAADVLLQVDLEETPLTLRTVNTENMQRSLGLQMAPDSMIYHLYQHTDGTFRLGRINEPDTIASQVVYTGSAIGNRNYQARQLPAFLPLFDPMIDVDFDYSGTCANVPTTFRPMIEPDADSVLWNFGDGSGSTDLAPFYTYESGGSYNVSLKVYLNGDSVSTSKSISITQFDLQISGFPQSDTVCAEDFPLQYMAEASSGQGGGGGGGGGGGSTNATFRWSNQDFDDATTTIDSAGSYYVTATDASTGCVAYSPLRVVEYGAIEQRAFIWYFGQHAGINFNPLVDFDNPGPAEPIPFGDPAIYNGGNQMVAPEGCAIYCDTNGNPLFYTDGEEMYDREGNPIASNLGGDSDATQSVLIVEFPNDATLFYVFLTRRIYDTSGNDNYQLSYVVFDLKMNNGLGGLMLDQGGNIAVTDLFNPNTERITGNNRWVITHQYGNKNFRVYPVTGTGIGAPVVSNVGSIHTSGTATAGQGYMKLSAANKLAVAISNSTSDNSVEIFNFEDSTGAVTDPVKLDIPDNGQVYGVEFSPDGRMLYATVRNPSGGGPSKIYRWQVDTTTVADQVTDPSYIKSSIDLVVNESGVDFGAMQLGPDGQIYIARQGSPNLAVLTNPGAVLNTTPQPDPGYVLDGFGLGSDLINGGNTTSTLGLPNFLTQFSTAPPDAGVAVSGGCRGEELTFTITNPETLETYRWSIFDSDSVVVATGIGEDFTFTPTVAGTYTARVDIIPDCQIVENPPKPVTAEFIVSELPQLSVSNVVNTSACQNTDGAFTLGLAGGNFFAYELSGPVSMISDTIPAGSYPITGLPAGTYNVYVINTETGCQSAISQTISDLGVQFSINATTQEAQCDSTAGTVQINLVPDAGYSIGYPVSYVIRQQGNNEVYTGTYDGADGLDQIVHTPVRAGTYNIEVTEGSGPGCTVTTNDVTVSTPPFAQLTLPDEVIICDDSPAEITFTTDAPGIRVVDPAPGDYEILDGVIRVTVPGTYIIETVDVAGTVCATKGQTEVIYTDPARLPDDFTKVYSICPEDPVEENTYAVIDPGPGIATVRYLDAEGGVIMGSGPDYAVNGNVLTVYVPGPVKIQLTNAFGCESEETIDILQDCKARINAPDAFRPDSPLEQNSSWRIFPFLVSNEDFQVFIFNRWGEMIFQSQDINFTWNGGYNNDPSRPVPVGSYAYKIQYKSSFEDGRGLQETRGGIVLLR